ncbi:MAG: hypothetical protein ABMA13_15005 [Chthoniobacteraceae bacterium]
MRLTPQEIRVVVFLLLALVAGAVVKHYRQSRPPAVSAEPKR